MRSDILATGTLFDSALRRCRTQVAPRAHGD